MDMKTWVASKGLQQACKYIGKDPEETDGAGG